MHPPTGPAPGPPELSGDYVRLPDLQPVRRHSGGLGAGLAAAGLLTLVWITYASGMQCAGSFCSTTGWWIAVVAAAGLALLGLVAWARRAPVDRRSGWRAVPTLVEVLLAGGAVLVLQPVLARPQLHLLYRSGVTFAAAVLLSAMVAWWVAAALHARLAGGPRWHEVVVGIVAALSAGSAWAAIAYSGARIASLLPALGVLWAVALGATVLAVRAAPDPRMLAGGGAAVATGLALLCAASSGNHLLAAYLPGPTAVDEPVPVPQPSEAVPTVPPEPTPATEPVSVAHAGDLCNAATLSSTISTPVPGGHNVYTTLTVTNAGDVACRLEGWPTVNLLSGGEDLALYLHIAKVDAATGEHVEDEPVLLEPGESGQTQVWWPGYGAAADMEADQELQVGLGGSLLTVPLAQTQKWDVVRSAEAWVAPWQPVQP